MRPSVTCLAAVAALCATSALADPGPDYGAFGKGTFLSYIDGPPPRDTLDAVPKLAISFEPGVTHPIVVDTGSTGVVVSADQVPVLRGPRCDRCFEYSSSGRILSGTWVTVPATITGGNGASVSTTPIAVLAVTQITCTPNARRCTPEHRPRNVDVMGIGFAREHDHMPDATPDTNPFLHIVNPTGGPMRRGYVVAKTGIHVGLTRSNTAGDFHFVKLAADPEIEGEWQPASACITINAPAAATCGAALIDSGVKAMFITVPPTAVEGVTSTDGALSTGTRLDIGFPGANGSTEAAYKLVVGDTDDPLAPSAIHLNTTRRPFVNTGLRFLNGFDVLYDADGGYVAFRKRQDGKRS